MDARARFARNILLSGWLSLSLPAPAQQSPAGDAVAIDSLARALTAGLETDSQKVRAVFTWVAGQVDYDVDKFLASRSFTTAVRRDASQSPGRVLQSRRAVCEGYANLLQALCRGAGLRAEVIEGIGRPEGTRTSVPHGWNAVEVDGRWRLLDVTWAAGGVDTRRMVFVRRFDDSFFLVRPADFILSHYPFDPAWQLLDRPVTRAQFNRGDFAGASNPLFGYADTLAGFFGADSLNRLLGVTRRTLDYDPGNAVAKANLESLANYLASREMNRANDLAAAAVNDYNACARVVNEARRSGEPGVLDRRESWMKERLAACRIRLEEAIGLYGAVRFTDASQATLRAENLRNMRANLRAVESLEKFIEGYFATPPGGRRRKL